MNQFMKVRYFAVLLCLFTLLLAVPPAQGLEIKGYDPALDQGLYKYSPRFREMAEFPPTEGYIEDGQALFKKNRNGKSCATCHGADGEKLVGAATHFPKYDKQLGKPKLLQQQINQCLKGQMGQPTLKWDSAEQVLLTLYVKSLSNGMPLAVRTDGPVAKFVAAGKKSFYERIGHFDVSCANCHETAAGTNIRAEYMSAVNNTGHKNIKALIKASLAQPDERSQRLAAGGSIGSGSIDHWPVYRLKWGKPASMQRRLRTCNKNIRAQPKKAGDDYYVNLELFLGSVSNGLPMNVPGFRP